MKFFGTLCVGVPIGSNLPLDETRNGTKILRCGSVPHQRKERHKERGFGHVAALRTFSSPLCCCAASGFGTRSEACHPRFLGIGSICRARQAGASQTRSEEHTSEPQSPMSISYAAFCLHKKRLATTLL